MKAFYADGLARLYCADVLEWALWYRAEIEAGRARPMHAIVTDPPYGLSEPPPIADVLTAWLAGERFDYSKSGFMGKSWDSLPPGPQIWRALLDITYPGGYLFCFSGTRTADLLGIACRLGGWEPFDRVQNFSWIFGSGFPKSLAIDKALDASEVVPCPDCQPKVDAIQGLDVFDRADHDNITFDQALLFMVDEVRMACETCGGSGEVVGAKRAVVGTSPNSANRTIGGMFVGENEGERFITAPATPLAQAFDGFGTALKPAHEPVLLFRRPRDGRTFAQCAREFGSGGLNIESCRVNARGEYLGRPKGQILNCYEWSKRPEPMKGKITSEPAGRWPPNAHFTHIAPNLCPTCNGAGCDECGGEGVVGGCRRVGSKRVTTSTGVRGSDEGSKMYGGGKGLGRKITGQVVGYADQDGLETVADWACVEGCAVRALDEMAGESKSGARYQERTAKSSGFFFGERENTGVRDYGDQGGPSRFFVCHDWSLEIAERLAGETPYAYVPKASRGERDAGLGDFETRKALFANATVRQCATHQAPIPSGSNNYACGCAIQYSEKRDKTISVRNTHACVKPLSLIKWLATLCLPPAQFNPRICVPFAGSGSEAIGAVLAGWTEIHAIEREQEYVEIAAERIAWWSKWARLTGKSDPDEVRKLGEAAEAKEAWQGDERQMSIFEVLE